MISKTDLHILLLKPSKMKMKKPWLKFGVDQGRMKHGQTLSRNCNTGSFSVLRLIPVKTLPCCHAC